MKWCDPAAPGRDQALGPSEIEDADNRRRWELCINRHHAAVRCLRALERAGILKRARDTSATE